MEEQTATLAVHKLCQFLYGYYGKKVLILLDEVVLEPKNERDIALILEFKALNGRREQT